MLNIMTDSEQSPIDQIQETGYHVEFEAGQSSIFIPNGRSETRTLCTIIYKASDTAAHITEQLHETDGSASTNTFNFMFEV